MGRNVSFFFFFPFFLKTRGYNSVGLWEYTNQTISRLKKKKKSGNVYSKHKGISFQGCCSYFKPKKEVLTQEKSMLRLNLTDIQTILKQNTIDLCTDSCDCGFWHFVPFEHCQVLVALRGCDVVLPPNSLPVLCNARPEERWHAHEAALVPAGWSRGFSGWGKPRSSCLASMGLLQACLSWSFCLPRDLLHWYHPTPG